MRSFGAVKRILFLSIALAPCALLAQPKERKPARHDAAMVAIIVPSDDPAHAQFNPAVHEPRVVVRNAGTDFMDMVLIEYGTEGFPMRRFVHGRRLRPGQQDTVQLPHLIDAAPGLNTFIATVSRPGGRRDRWKEDNTLRSTFTAADALSDRIVLQHRTGPDPAGEEIALTTTRGRVILNRAPGAWAADSTYSDTLALAEASYVLHFKQGSSSDGLRVLGTDGRVIKQLQGPRGMPVAYQFSVGGSVGVKP